MPEVTDRVIELFEGLRDGRVEIRGIVRELGWTTSQVQHFATRNGYTDRGHTSLDDLAISKWLLAYKTGKVSEIEAARKIMNIAFRTIECYPRTRRRKFVPPEHTNEVVERYQRGELLWTYQVAELIGSSDGAACDLLAARGLLRTKKETEEMIASQLASPKALAIVSRISNLFKTIRRL